MNFLIVAVAGILLERLVVAVGGVLALWLGFRLFLQFVNDVSKAELSGHGFKFKAERIGPGVFFALFGAAVLITAIRYPVSVSQDIVDAANRTTPVPETSAPTGSGTKTTIRGGMTLVVEEDAARIQLKSLITVANIAQRAGDETQKNALSLASVGLEALEANLIDNIFGRGRYIEWKGLYNIRTMQPDEAEKKLRADPELRKRFSEVDQALLQGF